MFKIFLLTDLVQQLRVYSRWKTVKEKDSCGFCSSDNTKKQFCCVIRSLNFRIFISLQIDVAEFLHFQR